MRTFALFLLATLGMAAGTACLAQDRPGRYTMSPADGGFVRLDTETGAMALCTRQSGQWACQPMSDPGRGAQHDAERLAAENKELKAEIRRLEELALGDDKRSPPERFAGRPGLKFELPTEQDVDRAMDYLGRMFRKFRDKLKEFDSERGGTAL